MQIQSNLQKLNAQIRQLEQEYHRPPGSVKLLAVSKGQSVEAILEAIQAGQLAFGENYLQEALKKIAVLHSYSLEWHFIGHIQSNKVKQIAEHFNWAHSVCSIRLAKLLGQARNSALEPLNICIQVNISNEASKSGVNLVQLDELAKEITKLPGIKLRGLMAIPQSGLTIEEQRKLFGQLHKKLQEINRELSLDLDTLSMGMSQDFAAAIAEGTTLVRLGTAIFGERNPSGGLLPVTV